ncbi:hypothetical protein QNH14_14445 [Apirhabdus apintestini]|nr:hypothetical protein QNH14_14445 [Enterobacteriaceae bacterium CA-0114]
MSEALTLLINSPTMRSAMGLAGRRQVERNHSWLRVVKRILSLANVTAQHKGHDEI